MRLAENQILKIANRTDGYTVHSSCVPSALYRTYYGAQSPAEENSVNTITDNMVNSHNVKLQNQKKINKYKKNITKDEEDGLRWLVKETSAGKIAVVKADKGGAMLIVYPYLLRQIKHQILSPCKMILSINNYSSIINFLTQHQIV